MSKYILALDQGTTSSRALLYNEKAQPIGIEQAEFKQHYPQPGWVEHDPEEIWLSQLAVTKKVIEKAEVSSQNIAGIGITNQRETTVLWHRDTGKPIYNAIVWQDRRTAEWCEELKENGHADAIQEKTGLVLDAYFSGTKIKWILDHIKGARNLAEQGKLLFGTIDTWLIWKLTGGQSHITDVSNASRTLLFNIHTLEWDADLMNLLDIPPGILPQVVDSSGLLATTDPHLFGGPIPICGIAGDQQSALFGQLCWHSGMVKNTYGTGCFLMLNTGLKPVKSNHQLLTTIAWRINGETTYALEGSVFVGGAVIQWLRDELEFFKEASESEKQAASVPDNGGVYFVPALTGLGAPYWDSYARGAIFGLTRGTTKNHISRAAIESICFQVNDVLKTMEMDMQETIKELRVDGGAVANNLLMQFQSDISKLNVVRPTNLETTALGAAFLAGLGVGFWDRSTLNQQWVSERLFKPSMAEETVNKHLQFWKNAVKRTLNWDRKGNE